MPFVKFSGSSIHYTTIGVGKPVVLLHGFLESSGIWEEIARTLSNTYRVILIDLPGHGKSDSMNSHSMENMATIVKAVLEETGTGKCTLIGHSMGGYVALAFAEKFSQLVSGLCLFHSTATADSEQKKKDRSRVIEVVKHDPKIFLSQAIPGLFAPENVSRFKKEVTNLIAQASKMGGTGIVKTLEGLRDRRDRTLILKTLTQPSLLIGGEFDPVIPINSLRTQAQLNPTITLCEVTGCGHMGFIEAPATIKAALTEYLTLVD